MEYSNRRNVFLKSHGIMKTGGRRQVNLGGYTYKTKQSCRLIYIGMAYLI